MEESFNEEAGEFEEDGLEEDEFEEDVSFFYYYY